jgi:ABC-type Fe3+-hydroxamate transport system substrate-binding protein/predicted Fe-S protein YdhL (DUF1289 family)
VTATAELTDAAGTVHAPAGPDARIVCLVPSITELLCVLGLGGRLVGRTGFCVHPWDAVRQIPKVGGTKDVRLDRVRELAPTHVIVNVDENTRETAQALGAFVEHVVVTHPLTPRDNLALYRLLGAIFDRRDQASQLAVRLGEALARAARARAQRPAQDVLYLIWREPWMTVSPQTYIAAMLAQLNWRTVPAAGVARYPEVDLAAYAGRVDRVLLSTEPYHFKAPDLAEVRALVPGAVVSLIDGEMVSWYGSRAIAGLDYLAAYTDATPAVVGGSSAPGPGAEAERRRIESPCIGVCVIDQDNDVCQGCQRTLGEIAVWGSSSPEQRRQILAAVQQRRAAA